MDIMCLGFFTLVYYLCRRCFFTSDSILMKSKFLNQLNVSFGSGGMTSALENNTLVEYFQYVQRDYDGQLPIKRGVLGPGFHSDVFVANENTFIAYDGNQLQPSQTSCVWLNRDAVFEQSKIKCADITPTIVHPLNNDVLCDYFRLLTQISKHNLIPTLIMVAGAVQCFHFESVVEQFGHCPIPVACGEPETGKSNALQAGLSLFGCDEIGMCVKASNSILLERACSSGMYVAIVISAWHDLIGPLASAHSHVLCPKITVCPLSIAVGLPFAVEESKKSKTNSKTNNFDLGELIMDLSNGSRSANLRTGSIKPKTGFLAASNYTLEQMEERYIYML